MLVTRTTPTTVTMTATTMAMTVTTAATMTTMATETMLAWTITAMTSTITMTTSTMTSVAMATTTTMTTITMPTRTTMTTVAMTTAAVGCVPPLGVVPSRGALRLADAGVGLGHALGGRHAHAVVGLRTELQVRRLRAVVVHGAPPPHTTTSARGRSAKSLLERGSMGKASGREREGAMQPGVGSAIFGAMPGKRGVRSITRLQA